jgi:hypothetical protein
MTVCVVLASLVPILWETGLGADVMKPIAAPIVGGMITSTIHLLILVPVLFAPMKERALRRGTLLGLTSMRERVRLVNGTITIESKPMGGTTIHCRVPLEAQQAFQQKAG